MIDIKKHPILGITTCFLLFLACLLEITLGFGLHNFSSFASHHGLAIFALVSLLTNWDRLPVIIKKFKVRKNMIKYY